MKWFLLFALVFSSLFSSCAPATQLPEPTITPSKSPNPTATPTITFTPTPTLPDIVLQMQKSEIPGITVNGDSIQIHSQTGELIADIRFTEAPQRLGTEATYILNDENGQRKLFLYNPILITDADSVQVQSATGEFIADIPSAEVAGRLIPTGNTFILKDRVGENQAIFDPSIKSGNDIFQIYANQYSVSDAIADSL